MSQKVVSIRFTATLRLMDVVRGPVVILGSPAELFASPTHDRTEQFLKRVTEAGRL